MLKRTVEIDGKEITFRASAVIPRMYRMKFGRDIIRDMDKLRKAAVDVVGDEDGTQNFSIDDLEIFENVAYIMAYHADNTIPNSIDEWLDQFSMFSIYEVLPVILDLWGANNKTDVEPKKRKPVTQKES